MWRDDWTQHRAFWRPALLAATYEAVSFTLLWLATAARSRPGGWWWGAPACEYGGLFVLGVAFYRVWEACKEHARDFREYWASYDRTSDERDGGAR